MYVSIEWRAVCVCACVCRVVRESVGRVGVSLSRCVALYCVALYCVVLCCSVLCCVFTHKPNKELFFYQNRVVSCRVVSCCAALCRVVLYHIFSIYCHLHERMQRPAPDPRNMAAALPQSQIHLWHVIICSILWDSEWAGSDPVFCLSREKPEWFLCIDMCISLNVCVWTPRVCSKRHVRKLIIPHTICDKLSVTTVSVVMNQKVWFHFIRRFTCNTPSMKVEGILFEKKLSLLWIFKFPSSFLFHTPPKKNPTLHNQSLSQSTVSISYEESRD